MKPSSKQKTKDITHRINRCEGHLRAIRRMVEDEKSCQELFIQLAAVRSALHEITHHIYEKHVDHCLASGKNKTQANRELKFISRLMLGCGD